MRPRSMPRVVLLLLLATAPTNARAQDFGFFSDLFKDVRSVTLFGTLADISRSPQLSTSASQCWFKKICGGGAEVLFDVTSSNSPVLLELGLGESYLRGF